MTPDGATAQHISHAWLWWQTELFIGDCGGEKGERWFRLSVSPWIHGIRPGVRACRPAFPQYPIFHAAVLTSERIIGTLCNSNLGRLFPNYFQACCTLSWHFIYVFIKDACILLKGYFTCKHQSDETSIINVFHFTILYMRIFRIYPEFRIFDLPNFVLDTVNICNHCAFCTNHPSLQKSQKFIKYCPDFVFVINVRPFSSIKVAWSDGIKLFQN